MKDFKRKWQHQNLYIKAALGDTSGHWMCKALLAQILGAISNLEWSNTIPLRHKKDAHSQCYTRRSSKHHVKLLITVYRHITFNSWYMF